VEINKVTMRHDQLSECVGFNVPIETQQVILEKSLSGRSTALVLATKNKTTKHYTHHKNKRKTEKPALANKTN